MQVLGDEKQRAWRCTFEGIKEIYSKVILNIPEGDCNRWAVQLSADITKLFTVPKIVAHWAIAGASGAGKTTSYQLAHHMVIHGYFQVKDAHSNDNLQELLNKEKYLFSANSAIWTADCKNAPANEEGSYGHVNESLLVIGVSSFFFLCVAFLFCFGFFAFPPLIVCVCVFFQDANAIHERDRISNEKEVSWASRIGNGGPV
jgi:hypothetical protein